MSGGTVRVVAVSPILAHVLAWSEDDPTRKMLHPALSDFLAGWEACERANNLPAARLAPPDVEADDGRS